jgi:transcriptional regulator with PAS, ATPase and Fis domain
MTSTQLVLELFGNATRNEATEIEQCGDDWRSDRGGRSFRDDSNGSELRLGGKLSVQEIETEHIRRVIANTQTLDEAATILRIDPATLYRKRKKL